MSECKHGLPVKFGCPQCEIESLRAELNEAADATGIAGVDKPMSLLECIQSLRADLAECREAVKNLTGNNGVFFTREQIDAAWRMANDDYDPVYTVGITEGFAILKAFNIVDCEECGGSGDELPPPGGGKKCRGGCGGHGWVVK